MKDGVSLSWIIENRSELIVKIVILAEKPSQAKAYAEAFQVEKREKTHMLLKPTSIFPDSEVVITWGIGHLVELKMPQDYKEEWSKWDLKNLPIIPDLFEFKVAKEKQTQFNAVKKLFKDAELIVNGCDSDREGSNIFYSILKMTGVKNKKIKRLWINSLEVDEVRKGFQQLQSNEKDLLMYDEARARQIGDWLVGINASQLYTLLLREKGLNTTLSVGRVQSALVYMIYQQEQKIKDFVSKPFFELFAKFDTENGKYEGKAKIKTDTIDELQAFLLENNLTLNEATSGVVKFVEKKQKATKSPQLHSLSTLQTTMNKKHKYSPALVLEKMQSLYEKKIVTYPRTDTNYITDNEFAYLVKAVEGYKQLVGANFEADLTPKKRYVDGSKVLLHYAIVPTKTVPSESTIAALSTEEKNIYDEILRTTLAMFHSDYVYEETKIVTSVHGVDFATTGKVEVSKGWKTLFIHQKNEAEDTSKNEEKTLPSVSESQEVTSVLLSKEGKTTPPKPYTQGDLIDIMKTCGKLVENEEEREILKEVEGIGTEATRSGIIETVQKNGYIEVKKNIVSVTEKANILCEAITGTLLSSPVMTAKWESYLKEIGNGKGSADAFVKNIEKFVLHLLQTAPEKLASAKIEQAIATEKQSHSLGTCPTCKKGEMIDKKSFVGCSEYQNGCKFSINKVVAGKKLTDKNIKDLLEKGKTTEIKGFTSSKGSKFNAILKVDASASKVVFEFGKKK